MQSGLVPVCHAAHKPWLPIMCAMGTWGFWGVRHGPFISTASIWLQALFTLEDTPESSTPVEALHDTRTPMMSQVAACSVACEKQLRVCRAQVEVLRMWQRDSHTLAVRWTLRCVPRILPGRVAKPLALDGISEYRFNSRGFIREHSVSSPHPLLLISWRVHNCHCDSTAKHQYDTGIASQVMYSN